MNSINDIQALLDSCGPAFDEKDVTLHAKLDNMGQPIPGTGITRRFCFKRLSFQEADSIRTHNIGPDGLFDPVRFNGNNARVVAATLVDKNTHAPVADVEEVLLWRTAVVDALARAANEVNGTFQGAEGEAVAEKNSGATPSVDSSST